MRSIRRSLIWLAVLALTFGVCTPAHATIALVANVGAGSSNTNTFTTGSRDTTGADLIICYIAEQESIGDSVLSDSKTNTWFQLTQQADVATANVLGRMFYCKNCTVGTGHTFTVTDSSGGPKASVACAAFSGSNTTTQPDLNDGSNNPNGSTTAQATTGITPSFANALVQDCVAWSGDTSLPTINGGFSTPVGVPFSSGVNFGVAESHLIQTTATFAQPTFTFAASSTGGNSLDSFKEAGGGGGGGSTSRRGALLGVGP
jgi:hypothetical protein